MKRTILNNLKHFFITLSLLVICLIIFGLYIGAEANLSEDRLAYKLDKEGPHIFYKDDQLEVNYVRGDQEQGFYPHQELYPADAPFTANVHFTLEGFDFNVKVDPNIVTPPVSYQDQQPIVAISDIESGFKGFRDFLIANKVIDEQLNWTHGKGHLVLVGDFVDRGASTTQVLWFIYKLEQEAKQHGGQVHFIIGNHEIKNLQGNYQSASKKYYYIASMLGKQQYQLFDDDSFIGRWMASKNSIERINGHLFVHGGIHPKISELGYSLEQINQTIRDNYRNMYFTKPNSGDTEFLISTTTGPAWYRGYFKDDLTQEEVEKGLNGFNAKAVVVGHTVQWNVSKLYDSKVFAIDVKQPHDYRTTFPARNSQGLLIESDSYYRLLDDGTRELL